MTFKPKVWYPIAVALSAINLGAVWFAARPGEAWHATIHAALALAFGVWARHLRRRPAPPRQLDDGLEALEIEMNALRQELSETQERLDFTERVMAQNQEARRVGPER